MSPFVSFAALIAGYTGTFLVGVVVGQLVAFMRLAAERHNREASPNTIVEDD